MKTPKGILNERKFSIGMVADSSNEVWTDIKTNIIDGSAWRIKRIEYTIEGIDPTIPIGASQIATDHEVVLQIHRNTDNETLLGTLDDDLLTQIRTGYALTTSGGGRYSWPLCREIDTITTQSLLRALFRSNVDVTNISFATYALRGVLYYETIKAPTTGRHVTKLGPLEDL